MEIEGQLIDIHQRRIYPARLALKGGKIASITELAAGQLVSQHYICPGFIDAHVHIESSMLPPAEFGRQALRHGTLATVSDPHEIANVVGLAGVEWMVANAKGTKMQVHFGAPSCVPATEFESAGARLGLPETEYMLGGLGLGYLSEMMNWPGVLGKDQEVMAKIGVAQRLGKPIDGHAPGLRGQGVKDYIGAGIGTDHECFTLAEAEEKLGLGMKILIREGSAAANLEALHQLLASHPDRVMICTDDMHPDTLMKGHINRIAELLLAKGYDIFDVLRACSYNTAQHYGLSVGLLRVGDWADFITLKNLTDMTPIEVFAKGECVMAKGKTFQNYVKTEGPNNFVQYEITASDFALPHPITGQIPVMVAIDGQIVTGKDTLYVSNETGHDIVNSGHDLCYIAVVNRYKVAKPAVGVIRGFGLKEGAIASSVAHDSHNIVVVGTSRAWLERATMQLMKHKGGIVAIGPDVLQLLPLPIAGLMSGLDGATVADGYASADAAAKQMGSTLTAPFMTLSFMALLVIPGPIFLGLG